MMDQAGMKDILRFLIALDTMHQQQWLALIEEFCGLGAFCPPPRASPKGNLT